MSDRMDSDSRHYNIFREAIKLEEQGVAVIHLEVGDPEIELGSDIINIMCKKAMEGHTHYSNPYGIVKFRESISEYLFDRLDLEIGIDQILVTPGSKTGLFLALNFLVGPGSRLVVFEPTWSAYKGLADSLSMEYISLKMSFSDNWIPNDDLINRLENIDFDVLILLNPSNPTGKLIPKKIIEKIIEITSSKEAILISDEVYFDTLFHDVDKYPAALKYEYENTIALYSLSKSHAMTGFRLGWVVTKKEWIDKLSRNVQYTYTNVPEFIQYAGVAALQNKIIPNFTRKVYMNRIAILADGLEKAGFRFIYPDGTFYIFAKMPDWIPDPNNFINGLLYEKGVAVAPGESFGGYNKFIRFSASVRDDKIREAINRINNYMDTLKEG